MILCDSCSPKQWCSVDKNRAECKFYQPMTNEEWFCGLSTEEKAEIIAQLSSYGGNVEAILGWLKEKHGESE